MINRAHREGGVRDCAMAPAPDPGVGSQVSSSELPRHFSSWVDGDAVELMLLIPVKRHAACHVLLAGNGIGRLKGQPLVTIVPDGDE
jgi:hypothetical protein